VTQQSDNLLSKYHVKLLAEDELILAVNKPSGLLVIPDRFDKTIPSLSGLLHHIYGGIYVVHRIDRETSGLVLFAKTAEAHRHLNDLFEHRKVEKRYLAIVRGNPESNAWTVDLALREHPAVKGKMMIDQGRGKEAATDFSIVERFEGFALVEARPRTGRTHQIRVHLAAGGTPVLGDPVYGDGKPFLLSEVKQAYYGKEEERPLLARTALHASALRFVHPGSGQPMALRALPPKDFEAIVRNLRKYRAGGLSPNGR